MFRNKRNAPTVTRTIPTPDGFTRSFVVELERGDENIFGQTVESVHRWDDHSTLVIFTDGTRSYYGNAMSTMLIKE